MYGRSKLSARDMRVGMEVDMGILRMANFWRLDPTSVRSAMTTFSSSTGYRNFNTGLANNENPAAWLTREAASEVKIFSFRLGCAVALRVPCGMGRAFPMLWNADHL